MKSIDVVIDLPIEEAEAVVREALAAKGFGVLTEIDVAATLKAKLGVDRNPLKILGACNPAIADRALSADHSVSLVLPCNVVLEARGDSLTNVAIADPRELLSAAGGATEELTVIAEEAAGLLEKAAAGLRRS